MSDAPGPRGLWALLAWQRRLREDVLAAYRALHREYGDVVRLAAGPIQLWLFFHPDHVHQLLTTGARSVLRYRRLMNVFRQWNGTTVLTAEGEEWVRRRRLVQHAFAPAQLRRYGEVMSGLAEQWASALADEARRAGGEIERPVDPEMVRLTVRIVCRTMFGVDPTSVTEQIHEAVVMLSQVAYREGQLPLRFPQWIPTAHNKRKRRAIQVLDGLLWDFIRQRRQHPAEGDLLGTLLQATDTETGQQLTEQEVRDEMMTLLLAGHDTTAAALNWLWYLLARYPEHAARCRAEVEEVVGPRRPTFDDLDKLHFLQAFVEETLRLYPPAGVLFMRQAETDVVIGGHTVPRGSLIGLSPYVTQRDERWYPNAEKFLPDRFLPPGNERVRPGSFFPFGLGPRRCIGEAFARTELMLVLASALRLVDVAPCTRGEPRPRMTMALRPAEPLVLCWRPAECATTVAAAHGSS